MNLSKSIKVLSAVIATAVLAAPSAVALLQLLKLAKLVITKTLATH
jgi:hypothetical protein